MTPSRREALLIAIAKARQWVEEVAQEGSSFAAIARREGKVERHVRLLTPLAFLSPRIVSALLDGTAPAHLTATTLVHALPWTWAEQERELGQRGARVASGLEEARDPPESAMVGLFLRPRHRK
jgi:hypothetical protein